MNKKSVLKLKTTFRRSQSHCRQRPPPSSPSDPRDIYQARLAASPPSDLIHRQMVTSWQLSPFFICVKWRAELDTRPQVWWNAYSSRSSTFRCLVVHCASWETRLTQKSSNVWHFCSHYGGYSSLSHRSRCSESTFSFIHTKQQWSFSFLLQYVVILRQFVPSISQLQTCDYSHTHMVFLILQNSWVGVLCVEVRPTQSSWYLAPCEGGVGGMDVCVCGENLHSWTCFLLMWSQGFPLLLNSF